MANSMLYNPYMDVPSNDNLVEMSWLLLITLNPFYALGLVLSYWFWSITFVSTHKERVDACVQYKECQSNYPRKISLAQRFVPSKENITKH